MILVSDLYIILTSNLLWYSHIIGDTLCIVVGSELFYTRCHAYNYKFSLTCREGLTCL
jgi:hypothetical protein